MTIGQLAKAGGVPTSTVRFYERAGLVRPNARTGSNYRCYDPSAADRLRFIRAAQASGFSLSDIREMLALTAGEGLPCEDILALIRRRLAEVRVRMAELRRVERTLATSLLTCCKREPDWCGQIVRLKGRSAVPRRPAR